MTLPVALFLGLGAIALFSFIAVAAWSDSRRQEREAYFKSETLKSVAAMESGAASSVLAHMRQEAKDAARRVREGLKLGGLITFAAGIGLMVFLLFFKPGSPVYFVGLIPMLIGVALLLYAYVLGPKD